MLVTMPRSVFDSLDQSALGWACIAPTIEQIQGKSLSVKSRVYAQLTDGQRSLLMFWVLYGHARDGIARFYSEIDYLLEAGLWSELKRGLQYFGDDTMVRLVDEMEALHPALVSTHQSASAQSRCFEADRSVRESRLSAHLGRLEATYALVVPASIERIGTYIRAHPDEFVHFAR